MEVSGVEADTSRDGTVGEGGQRNRGWKEEEERMNEKKEEEMDQHKKYEWEGKERNNQWSVGWMNEQKKNEQN